MGEKLVVGPINRGLRNDRTAFVIDNDSFPTLINAYQWRGRIKRKRGTSLLGRLTRFFNSSSTAYSATATITLDGSGNGNLLTGFSLQSNGNIVPGSVTITDITFGNVYTDDSAGNLIGVPAGTGTINYATGVIIIAGGGAHTISASFSYTPDLPVMGLRDLILTINQYAGTLAFDTTYSYNISTASPYPIYDVSFYKNPNTAGVGYVPKATWTPTSWNGQDYQQFWTVNYQGALWATNGINIPFSITNIGMQFKTITAIIINAVGPPAKVTITIGAGHNLVIGDFVFLNEIVGITGINYQTGYVTAVAATTITVTLPNATLAGAYASDGIVQYLTNRADPTKDCLRWYDGDPTNGSAAAPVFVQGHGWVNFAPPLTFLNNGIFSIADTPPGQYYLVGARLIVPYKDFLLFLGPVIQTSSQSPIYLEDTVIYSQNGTPYYTASFTATNDDPTLSNTVFHPILVPTNQTATPTAYFEDITGFGGFKTAGIDQQLISASLNEDVFIIGFSGTQTRLIYSGNNLDPFNFYFISSEFGTASTFSTINMGKAVMSKSRRGYVLTSQVECNRFDLDIPDQVFEVNLTNNGAERVTAQRDYINEWVYFTYVSNESASSIYRFPNQTLMYNYRDNSWAIFNETYTTYGLFRRQTGFTWSTVGEIFPTWEEWNDPWDAGESTLLNPELIAGNQQGFVLVRDEGTSEAHSLYIKSFSGNTVTSPNHGLNTGDYIIISGVIGTIGTAVNGKIFQIYNPTQNTFQLLTGVLSGTYSGGGLIQRLYVPFIQTKQFPTAWGLGRKTRIGVQQYLLSTTFNGQITLLIYLSQDGNNPYNAGALVPSPIAANNSLIYSTILYTCPESTNLGLTAANVNLQMPTAINQSQIWHRINTSLIGDTVQLGFTLSDAQMRNLDPSGVTFNITGATQANPCVLTTLLETDYPVGQLVLITGVNGMTQLNNNYYVVTASDPTTVTIQVDSTAFSPYTNSGFITAVGPNQFQEIELHSFIIDVSPSQLLS